MVGGLVKRGVQRSNHVFRRVTTQLDQAAVGQFGGDHTTELALSSAYFAQLNIQELVLECDLGCGERAAVASSAERRSLGNSNSKMGAQASDFGEGADLCEGADVESLAQVVLICSKQA